MINIKKGIKLFGNILTVLSIVFLIVTMIKLDIDFSQIKNVSYLIQVGIVGSVIMTLRVYAQAFAWKIILENLSGKIISLVSLIRVYVKSNMGKYLPGNVMHYVERNIFATQMGLGQLEVAAGSVIEIGAQALTAILFSIMISFRDFMDVLRQIVSYKTVLIFFVAAVLFVIVIIVGCLFVKQSRMRTIIKMIFRPQFWVSIGKTVPIYIAVLLSSGIVLLFICKYVLACDLSTEESLFIVSIYILAWLFGFIIPGSPGGLGVREFVLVLLLSSTIGERYILLAALLHRMICIIGDILAYVALVLIRKKE